jgi:NhaP-type Na+/H+ or K+/H+ antiporter
MNQWALPTIALLLIGYGALSGRLQSTMVTQAMVFVAFGLVVGNRVLDLVDVDTANQFVRHLAEATLTLVLFTDAVRVNLDTLRRESALPTRLLGVGLPLTIVAGTLAGLALFPQLNLWTAAALATILAPTDAALGLPVVSNRRLPSRIRQGLNVESGLNDGVCVPLLIIFLTIVAGTAAALALFAELDLWTAAALATMLAPTDAALGLPVISNRRLPSRIRQGLNVESGLNDGVCVPLLIIFLTLAAAEEGAGDLDPVRVVLEEIGFGAVGGVAAGALGAWVLRGLGARGWMEGTWKQINTLATPLLAYGIAVALGGSGFIAAFVAGITFGVVARERAEETTYLAEQGGELLNAVTFLLFGAVLLGPALGDPDWRVIGYAVLSLTVVRMLPVALAMVGTGMRRVTVGFLGWFGPRGLASIVFVLILVEQTDLPERSLLLDVVTWTVALSVYAHGLTAWPGANRYADWYAAHARDHPIMPESTPVAEPRLRIPVQPSGR